MKQINFLIPSTKPVGGIIKIFDYVCHAQELGYKYDLFYRSEPDFNSPIFNNNRYKKFKTSNYKLYKNLQFNKFDLYFFSWPEDFKFIQNIFPSTNNFNQVIHIVQNIRHGNPDFCNGYALKLLSYPINRIILGDITYYSVKKFLSTYGLNDMIEIGHDLEFFNQKRINSNIFSKNTIKVSYTTWKSDLGKKIELQLSNDNRFKFKHISKVASLHELKLLYHWSDVFLGCPNRQEGTYLPGLEALASGISLIMPDVGGNMVYAKNNPNVFLVNYDDPDSYVDALKNYAANLNSNISNTNNSDFAYEKFNLSTECENFNKYLQKLT